MSIIQVSAILVVLSALLGWVNKVFIGLPHAIALLVMGMVGTLGILTADYLIPQFEFARYAHQLLTSVNFFETVMTGMLSFLLFAGALHVNLDRLREQRVPIILMASVGVLISTFVVAVGFHAVCRLFGIDISLIWCLVFGALISPTDPVAVLAVMKTIEVDKNLETKIAGESLFNDGVGVIAFTVLVGIAVASDGLGAHAGVVNHSGSIDWWHILEVFSVEVFGAIAFGLIAGATVIGMMKRVDDAAVETLISLALVLGTSVLCSGLHMSAPIAVVVAGLMIGNIGAKRVMSERTRNHLFPFWGMVDEILNSVLFLLIGMEVLIIQFAPAYIGPALLCVPIVLAARFASVAIPIRTLHRLRHQFAKGSIRIMTWGGVRGGVSVALALSLPHTEAKPLIMMATYVVVCFSIIVQGLTIGPLVKKISSEPGCMKDMSTAM
ncbi:sodium:proton antiporter [Rhizobium laguerreae]|uniref:cation:proton antiporter n=1 Tax=Rhizobium laguerreae TaxID=1076926 RepID=UPI001C91A88E|nr:sodium:proton antiporter [Rhizobium laguerreae]MBY3150852.1 sodium:proton antiporter [Rhizobium laguerreae]